MGLPPSEGSPESKIGLGDAVWGGCNEVQLIEDADEGPLTVKICERRKSWRSKRYAFWAPV
jgi:hypothetical protein